MLDLTQSTDTDDECRYHTLSQRGNDATDVTRTHSESPSCNDVVMTRPDPDLPPRDDDVPWAVPPPQRDSDNDNDNNIVVVPTTAPLGPPCLRCDVMTMVMCPRPYHHRSMTPPSQPNNDVEPVPPW